jgi:hypothetical protein
MDTRRTLLPNLQLTLLLVRPWELLHRVHHSFAERRDTLAGGACSEYYHALYLFGAFDDVLFVGAWESAAGVGDIPSPPLFLLLRYTHSVPLSSKWTYTTAMIGFGFITLYMTVHIDSQRSRAFTES